LELIAVRRRLPLGGKITGSLTGQQAHKRNQHIPSR
jgi:hypothetical protein